MKKVNYYFRIIGALILYYFYKFVHFSRRSKNKILEFIYKKNDGKRRGENVIGMWEERRKKIYQSGNRFG